MTTGAALRVYAVHLPRAREYLHMPGPSVRVADKRGRYAMLTAISRSIGDFVLAGSPGAGARFLTATPGHSVLLAQECFGALVAERVDVAAESLRRWGVEVRLRDRGPGFSLAPDSWPAFAAGWTNALADDRSKEDMRARFVPQRADGRDDLMGLPDKLTGEFGQILRQRWRGCLSSLDNDGAPDIILHGQVPQLLSGQIVPGGLAQLRIDVKGYRKAAIAHTKSGKQLLKRTTATQRWFEFEVPAKIRGINTGLDECERCVLLHSVADDAVIVGARPVLMTAFDVLSRAYAALGTGRLTYGIGGPGGCADLAELAKAALADLTARSAEP